MKRPHVDSRPMVLIQFFRMAPSENSSGYNRNSRALVWEYLMTRKQYDTRRFDYLVQWRQALLVIEQPTHKIDIAHCFYDQITGDNLCFLGHFNKMVSAKAQVTKIKNSIDAARCKYVPTMFEPTLEDTDAYKKAMLKLADYEQKVIEYSAKAEAEKFKIENGKPL